MNAHRTVLADCDSLRDVLRVLNFVEKCARLLSAKGGRHGVQFLLERLVLGLDGLEALVDLLEDVHLALERVELRLVGGSFRLRGVPAS